MLDETFSNGESLADGAEWGALVARSIVALSTEQPCSQHDYHRVTEERRRADVLCVTPKYFVAAVPGTPMATVIPPQDLDDLCKLCSAASAVKPTAGAAVSIISSAGVEGAVTVAVHTVKEFLLKEFRCVEVATDSAYRIADGRKGALEQQVSRHELLPLGSIPLRIDAAAKAASAGVLLLAMLGAPAVGVSVVGSLHREPAVRPSMTLHFVPAPFSGYTPRTQRALIDSDNRAATAWYLNACLARLLLMPLAVGRELWDCAEVSGADASEAQDDMEYALKALKRLYLEDCFPPNVCRSRSLEWTSFLASLHELCRGDAAVMWLLRRLWVLVLLQEIELVDDAVLRPASRYHEVLLRLAVRLLWIEAHPESEPVNSTTTGVDDASETLSEELRALLTTNTHPHHQQHSAVHLDVARCTENLLTSPNLRTAVSPAEAPGGGRHVGGRRLIVSLPERLLIATIEHCMRSLNAGLAALLHHEEGDFRGEPRSHSATAGEGGSGVSRKCVVVTFAHRTVANASQPPQENPAGLSLQHLVANVASDLATQLVAKTLERSGGAASTGRRAGVSSTTVSQHCNRLLLARVLRGAATSEPADSTTITDGAQRRSGIISPQGVVTNFVLLQNLLFTGGSLQNENVLQSLNDALGRHEAGGGNIAGVAECRGELKQGYRRRAAVVLSVQHAAPNGVFWSYDGGCGGVPLQPTAQHRFTSSSRSVDELMEHSTQPSLLSVFDERLKARILTCAGEPKLFGVDSTHRQQRELEMFLRSEFVLWCAERERQCLRDVEGLFGNIRVGDDVVHVYLCSSAAISDSSAAVTSRRLLCDLGLSLAGGLLHDLHRPRYVSRIRGQELCEDFFALVAGSPQMTSLMKVRAESGAVADDYFLQALCEALEFPKDSYTVVDKAKNNRQSSDDADNDDWDVLLTALGARHVDRLRDTAATLRRELTQQREGTAKRVEQQRSTATDVHIKPHQRRPAATSLSAASTSKQKNSGALSVLPDADNKYRLRFTPHKTCVDASVVQALAELEHSGGGGGGNFKWHRSAKEKAEMERAKQEECRLERLRNDPLQPPWRREALTPLGDRVHLTKASRLRMESTGLSLSQQQHHVDPQPGDVSPLRAAAAASATISSPSVTRRPSPHTTRNKTRAIDPLTSSTNRQPVLSRHKNSTNSLRIAVRDTAAAGKLQRPHHGVSETERGDRSREQQALAARSLEFGEQDFQRMILTGLF